MQPVAITTYVVSSNLDKGRGVQHYVIKFVSDLRQTGRWFSPDTPISSTNKTDRHDITEILLEVALNTKQEKQTSGFYYEIHFDFRKIN